MTKYTNSGDTIVGKRLIFEGRKVGKPQIFQKSKTHRGQRVQLDDGECWIETPIELPKKKENNIGKKNWEFKWDIYVNVFILHFVVISDHKNHQ